MRAAGVDPNDPLADLTVEQANDIGRMAQAVAAHWDRLLNDDRFAVAAAPSGRLLGRGLPALVVSLFIHSLAMHNVRATAPGGPISVLRLQAARADDLFDSTVGSLTPQPTNYFALAAAADPSDDIEIVPIGAGAVGPNPIEAQETERFSILSRLCHTALQWSARAQNPLLERLVPLCGVATRALMLVTGNRLPGRRVLIYRNSGAIVRLSLPFIARGVGVAGLALAPSPKVSEAPADENLIDELVSKGEADIGDSLQPWHTVAMRAAATRIAVFLANGAKAADAGALQTARTVLADHGRAMPPIVLTNGLYAPHDNILREHLLKAGIRCVEFSHGATGMLEQYRHHLLYFDIAHSRYYVSFAQNEIDFYDGLKPDSRPTFFLGGSQGVTTARRPTIARWAGRRIWGVDRNERLILYAPTRFMYGQYALPDMPLDMPYWETMRRLVERVLARAEGRRVVKLHRKGLVRGQAAAIYERFGHPLEHVDLPPGVEVRYAPDLTYMRHAADVILIDRATSTIGWAMDSQRPIVYLEQETCPLTPTAREAIGKGLFLVDDCEGWEERLSSLLASPKREFEAEWNDKSPDRKRLHDVFTNGPRVSARSLVNQIIEASRPE